MSERHVRHSPEDHSALSYTAQICQPLSMPHRVSFFGNPHATIRVALYGAKPLPRRDVLNIRAANHAARLNILNIRAGTAPR